MGTALRLVWKQYRFELLSMVIAIALLTGFALVTTARLDGIRPTPQRLELCTQDDAGLEAPECSDVAAWLGLRDTEAFRLFGALPFIAGILLGSVLVSREIEHRTAQLGWSLSGSRRRWLFERVAPVAVLLVVLLTGLAIAADLLEGARYPEVGPRASLHEYGQRGTPILMHGLAAFGGAVLLGAIVGRQLPALILGGVLAIVLGYGLTWAFPFGAAWQWVTEDEVRAPAAQVAHRTNRRGFRASDGTILSDQEAAALAPEGLDSGPADDWLYEHHTAVTEVLKGEQLTEIELRESLGLGVIAVLSLGASFVVVQRRRPY